ncbi:TIGR03087 family PEP-CTERM/XrtA system glycosyltransferase [Salinisphaera sp.]|uniref:TIGR03087 family PEP-CTERM/XrtA system glycosyltransferase n=1 Tax=Salinisphaera sp. TaxID=1914330 RepID=UPI002D7887BC|nr:TIGR03087 family PEP-CTERM/XrtA system glycosyltransferase [Salinisphaera sp.]HET7314045.1 TIGR03087 family PEP-CTERM/XrtA system glycosyltransferase [Salinisphaera sp.]
MAELLYLCHRIPYPPNKGDKIRAFNWLRALAERHTVHLGSFVDDSADWAHRAVLDRWCDQVCLRPLAPRRAKLRSLSALARGEALSFAYYRDRALQDWVDRLMAERRIDAVLVFSSTMAPYVAGHAVRRVLDFVDVDSDKWAQYAAHTRGPMRRIYAREANTLAAGERRLARSFDASIFVSAAEADFFRRMAPDCAARVHAIANGVYAEYFDPDGDYAPAAPGATDIVFTGAMDYGANVDAVCWFVEQVWPRVRQAVPEARFTIVGTRPTRRVQALAEHAGVVVTGAVPDVRPYLARARVAVAPMRIARGLQNKVLEAFAMARPVVMTPQAEAGLEPGAEAAGDVVAAPEAFAAAVIARLAGVPDEATRRAARGYVLTHYAWAARFAELDRLIEGVGYDVDDKAG